MVLCSPESPLDVASTQQKPAGSSEVKLLMDKASGGDGVPLPVV